MALCGYEVESFIADDPLDGLALGLEAHALRPALGLSRYAQQRNGAAAPVLRILVGHDPSPSLW